MKIRLPANGWRPRPHQLKLWLALESGILRAIEIAHRRWGKDEVALHFAATKAMQEPATYWHMLPEYAQARKAIWNAINPHTGIRRIDEAFPLEIRAATNDHEMFIRFKNNSTWQVVGSDNYKALVGAPPKGIVFSEWAKANPAALAYLEPILLENDGWAIFITTPEGKNHAHGMYKMALKDEDWFAELQTVEDTGFPVERVEKTRLLYHELYGEEAGDALIDQEYYCSFEAAILGSVYGKQMAKALKDGRINANLAHDPNYPVYTAHDLGYDDLHAVIWYQVGIGEIFIIDYHEESGLDPKGVCEILYGKKIIVDERDMKTGSILKWKFGEDLEAHKHRQAYNYHTTHAHHGPHDLVNKVQAAGGKSTLEQCGRLGITFHVMPAGAQQDDQAALRSVLPRCWFGKKAEKLTESLSNYHRKWDEDKKIFSKDPVHDHNSHGCDAAEIMAKVYRDKTVTTKELHRKAIVDKFHRLRRENNMDKQDPYRVKKVRKK